VTSDVDPNFRNPLLILEGTLSYISASRLNSEVSAGYLPGQLNPWTGQVG